MNKERLKLENELLITKSKAMMINLYLDKLEEIEKLNKNNQELRQSIQYLVEDLEILEQCENIDVIKMNLRNIIFHLKHEVDKK